MQQSIPKQFDNVSVVCKANVYFEGKVVSRTILFPDWKKKTLGIIYSGSYSFNTDAPEGMEMVAGPCRVKLAGETQWIEYPAGSTFQIPGKSSFEIAVDHGLAEYICTFE